MGKKQTIQNFKTETLTPQNWNEISSIIDYMDNDTINTILDSEHVKLYNKCCRHNITNGRELIKDVFSVHAGTSTNDYSSRYLKRASKEISESVINAIVNAKIN